MWELLNAARFLRTGGRASFPILRERIEVYELLSACIDIVACFKHGGHTLPPTIGGLGV